MRRGRRRRQRASRGGEAALEFAQCMRDNGIEEFADPQISADGRISLRPPDGVGFEELAAGEAVCGHILDEAGWPRDPSGSLATAIDAPSGPVTAAGSEWEKVVPGGDCMCADGSEFAFWERRADPTKVVFFLDGGGTCYDATKLRLHRPLRWRRARTMTGASTARTRQPRAGSSTSPAPTIPSPSTASSTCRPAPVTCISATSPGSTRRS